jgi:hypothetical protein
VSVSQGDIGSTRLAFTVQLDTKIKKEISKSFRRIVICRLLSLTWPHIIIPLTDVEYGQICPYLNYTSKTHTQQEYLGIIKKMGARAEVYSLEAVAAKK